MAGANVPLSHLKHMHAESASKANKQKAHFKCCTFECICSSLMYVHWCWNLWTVSRYCYNRNSIRSEAYYHVLHFKDSVRCMTIDRILLRTILYERICVFLFGSKEAVFSVTHGNNWWIFCIYFLYIYYIFGILRMQNGTAFPLFL